MEMDFEKICRTCLSSDCPLVSIFENNVTDLSESESSSVIDLLTTLTDIKISTNPGLPDHICSTCVDELKRVYSFKLKCEKSETVLIKYLQDKHNYLNKNTISCSSNDIQFLDADMDTTIDHTESDKIGYESEKGHFPESSKIPQNYTGVICIKEEDENDDVISLSEDGQLSESSKTSQSNTEVTCIKNRNSNAIFSPKNECLPESSKTSKSYTDAKCGTKQNINNGKFSSEQEDLPESSRTSDSYSDAICLKEENIDDVLSFSSDCESIQGQEEISEYNGTDINMSEFDPQKEFDTMLDYNEDDIEVHVVTDEKHESKQAQCPACSHVCKNTIDLLQHISVRHTMQKTCKICKKDYKSIKSHIKIHVSDCFPCPICGLEVKQRRYLFRHMKRKHKIKEVALFLDQIEYQK